MDGIRRATGPRSYREALWDAVEEFVDLKTVRGRMRYPWGFAPCGHEQLELGRMILIETFVLSVVPELQAVPLMSFPDRPTTN